jgi:hypothetical protein
MSDEAILHEILARGEGFGHRQHVELTWRYLVDHDPGAARVLVADAIRRVAAAHGAAGKFHATITEAWVRCVAVHRERWPAASFDQFIERNAALLNPKLLEHHYTHAALFSERARAEIVDPDIRPLPALAA